MAKRYKATTPREYKRSDGTADTFWRVCGTGFPTKDGKGIRLILEALPVNGQLLITADEPKEQQAPSAPADDIPF